MTSLTEKVTIIEKTSRLKQTLNHVLKPKNSGFWHCSILKTYYPHQFQGNKDSKDYFTIPLGHYRLGYRIGLSKSRASISVNVQQMLDQHR